MKKPSWGPGCLILFALPFAAVGVITGYQIFSTLWDWAQIQSWDEVPAQILEVELITHTGDDSVTFSVKALYSYSYMGDNYTADRVSLSGGADNLGSFHQDVYEELAAYRDSGEPFPCLVNPKDPSQSILYPTLRWGLLAFLGVFTVIFGGVGFGLIAASLFGGRWVESQSKLKKRFPTEPWRWKPEWNEGRVSSASKGKMLFVWGLAIFWNVASLPLVFVLPEEAANGNTVALIGLVFPAVGLLLLSWAIYQLLQWRKFGNSVFEMASLPAVPGGSLQGRILTGVKKPPSEGFHLALSCSRKRRTGSGDSSSTSTRILWQDTQTVRPEQLGLQPSGYLIPVRIAIPSQAAPTDERDSDDQVLWHLKATASLPGIDYSAQFDVPVFASGESDASAEAEFVAKPDKAASFGVQELDKAGIHTHLLPQGRRYTFRAARQKGAALGLTLFTLIWYGFVAILYWVGAPLLFSGLFGAVGLLLLLGVLEMWLGVRNLEFDGRQLTFWGGLFGLGRRHSVPFEEIEKLEAVRGLQAGDRLFYRIQIRTRAGKTHILATQLGSKQLARSLIKEIQRSAPSWASINSPAEPDLKRGQKGE